jgi:hypothetical protein
MGGRAQGIVVPESFECVCALAARRRWSVRGQHDSFRSRDVERERYGPNQS